MIGMEYQIAASSRRCARTGRTLAPGEKFFSVLYDRGGGFERQDISLEAWDGPPADAFSFWISRLPHAEQPRKIQFDDDLLFECFTRLEAEADEAKIRFRYILALLLMRRKRLKFEEAVIQDGEEYLHLRCSRTRQLHRILNPRLTEAQLAEVQAEVQNVLGVSG